MGRFTGSIHPNESQAPCDKNAIDAEGDAGARLHIADQPLDTDQCHDKRGQEAHC